MATLGRRNCAAGWAGAWGKARGSGGLFAGVVRQETDAALTLLTPDEGEVTLDKKDLRTRNRGPSGMPEGFGEVLTRFELRDLVEFLGTLK